jgi:two-component system copper resistance phosphate regulon response regulator CusR
MKILSIEDKRKLGKMITRGHKAEGNAVDFAEAGNGGQAIAENYNYALTTLDLMLPGLSWQEFLKRIRADNGQVPFLILSTQAATESKGVNFEAGARHYPTKTFAFAELAVRMMALLGWGAMSLRGEVQVADLKLDTLAQQVRRRERRINLTPKEYALTEYPVTQTARVFFRTMMVEHGWDRSFEGLTTIADVCVRRLLEKIDAEVFQKFIHAIRGVGCCLAEGLPS